MVVVRDCSGQRCFIEIVIGDALRAYMGQILPKAVLWAAFSIVDGMGLSLSAAFLSAAMDEI